jgi:Uncharacterized conserved protein
MHTITSNKCSRVWQAFACFALIVFGSFFVSSTAFSAANQSPPSGDGFVGQPVHPGGYTGQPLPQGGYTGPGLAPSSVSEVRSLPDDSYVVMRGNIVRSLGGERYLFQDATGTITVEIDHELWQGQSIGHQDLVEIHGEIDRDLFSIEVEADKVVKQ